MTQKEKDDLSLRLPDWFLKVLKDESIAFDFNVVYEEVRKELVKTIGDKPKYYKLYEVIAFESAMKSQLRLTMEKRYGRPVSDEELSEFQQFYYALLLGKKRS